MPEFVKSCDVCQMVGKPNQNVNPAPLKPAPAFDEQFSRVIIEYVGPIPMVTVIC